jgi:hypothetical protein
MLADDDTGQDSLRIDSHEHGDRTAVSALGRHHLGRPEGVADDGLGARAPPV